MGSAYEYYKDICNCPGTPSSGAGANEAMYDFQKTICVCRCELIYLTVKDGDGNDTGVYPVSVYNVNEQLLGEAANKSEFIALWNSDEANREYGRLRSSRGPFGFYLDPVECGVAPDYLIGVSTSVDTGIYAMEYDEPEYE